MKKVWNWIKDRAKWGFSALLLASLVGYLTRGPLYNFWEDKFNPNRITLEYADGDCWVDDYTKSIIPQYKTRNARFADYCHWYIAQPRNTPGAALRQFQINETVCIDVDKYSFPLDDGSVFFIKDIPGYWESDQWYTWTGTSGIKLTDYFLSKIYRYGMLDVYVVTQRGDKTEYAFICMIDIEEVEHFITPKIKALAELHNPEIVGDRLLDNKKE